MKKRTANPARRRFLVRTGWVAGGLTVIGAGGCMALPALPTFGKPGQDDSVSWVQLQPSGRIRFLLPRAEMGQGISIGLSWIVARELNIGLDQIDCHYQSTELMAPCQMTVGSQSIENFWALTAQAAATMRETLRARAAGQFKVSAAQINDASGGFEFDGQSVKYAALMSAEESTIVVTDMPNLRLYSDSSVPTEKSDETPQKPLAQTERIVRGTETYSRDVHIERMQFGQVARGPHLGAELIRYDRSAAEAVPGVTAVIESDGQVGVVAKTPMAAQQAMQALAVQWERISDSQRTALQPTLDIDDFIRRGRLDHEPVDSGSLADGKQAAVKTFSQRYDTPMVAHAAMEPRAGVAHWQTVKDGSPICEVWTGSQDPWLVRATIAKRLGISADDVIVHNHRIGGGFGGRVLCQASVEAAWLSHGCGEPVKVQWSREDEFAHNYVGPPFSTRIEAGLDDQGKISFWHHQAVGAPVLTSSMFIPPYLHWLANLVPDPGTRRGMQMPYQIENQCVEYADERIPMPTGPWRGLGAAPNAFAVESAIDELALAVGADPISFRLAHLDHPRLAQCLSKLREKLDGVDGTPGVAAAIYKGVTPVAVAALATDTGDGPRITRLICVHDCGRVFSDDQVRAQIEGNLAWGVSMAQHESFELAQGTAGTDNFDRYFIARQSDVPDIEIELIQSNEPPSGAAEAALAPVAAAIANALSRATGERIRQLPIRLDKARVS